MDTKLFARIGAGAFVAIALTMSLLQLREERPAALPEVITVWEPDGDPLPGQLRACSAMGELALSSPDCRAAWAACNAPVADWLAVTRLCTAVRAPSMLLTAPA